MKEHTKPIFHKHKILVFKNLYNYQICLETLKILKSKIPYYLFQLHPLSSRNNQNFLVAKRNSSLFITNRIKLWNQWPTGGGIWPGPRPGPGLAEFGRGRGREFLSSFSHGRD